MMEGSISQLPFNRLDRSRQLSSLGDADYSIITRDARFSERIDNCANPERIERYRMEQARFVDAIGQVVVE
jgi:hypothetical protein